jgi:MoaA/NifB/PqqE/SkfB family radical SAM enzyme
MSIREREGHLRERYRQKKLKFDESTYHFSSEGKEKEFIVSQFPTVEEREKYKVYREEWHRRSDEMDAGTFPLAVIAELVSSCNLRCEMCYTVTPEFQDAIVGAQRVLSWDMVVRIIDECVELDVYSMLFSWRGESAMYRSKGSDGKVYDYADVLSYARKKGILEVTSLTNGRSLNDELIEKIVKAQPNWISFSIDGMFEDYGKIRKVLKREEGKDPFQVVIGNMKKMIEVRNELGQSKPQIRTNTIFPPIAKDPEGYRKFMEDLGVGLVTVNEMMDYRGAELPDEAVLSDWFCQYPFQRLVVSANGIILPCPGSHNEEEELILGRYLGAPEKRVMVNGKKEVVHYPEITLKEAWESDRVKEIRKLHANNKRADIWACKHCRHGAGKFGVEWVPPNWDMENMQWVGRSWRNG